ncbi:hypothetical protein, partial [Lactiplantibacillus mudanjiangensis]|uniref:hypothetical protein n=1 Tax=Lactiplantibacillus mudanjiangensis TaxID=1296538 RepID=UPI001CDB4AF2
RKIRSLAPLISKFLSRTNKTMGAAQTCKLCQLDPINERELPLIYGVKLTQLAGLGSAHGFIRAG